MRFQQLQFINVFISKAYLSYHGISKCKSDLTSLLTYFSHLYFPFTCWNHATFGPKTIIETTEKIEMKLLLMSIGD